MAAVMKARETTRTLGTKLEAAKGHITCLKMWARRTELGDSTEVFEWRGRSQRMRITVQSPWRHSGGLLRFETISSMVAPTAGVEEGDVIPINSVGVVCERLMEGAEQRGEEMAAEALTGLRAIMTKVDVWSEKERQLRWTREDRLREFADAQRARVPIPC